MAYTTVVTAAAHEPVTLDELKGQVNIPLGNTDHNALLWRFIREARTAAEKVTQRALVTRTLDFPIDAFPAGDVIRLPWGSLQSITSLKYTDSAGSETTWAAANYSANTVSEPGELVLAFNVSWPSVTLKPRGGIVIRFVCGYGTGDLVNEEIRMGILMYASNRFIYREATAIPEEKPTAAFDIWRDNALGSQGSQPGVRL